MKEKLSPEKINEYLEYQIPVHVFESVTSTNTVAADMAKEGAAHGTAVIAIHQTNGRGRLGRSFASPSGDGIYMSVILEPWGSNPVLITTVAAVAVCSAIEKICRLQPAIKWVNDIYLNNKKVCGILAEAVTDYKTGHITHVILGIGINCNESAIPEELRDIAGAIEGDFSVNQLTAEVINHLLCMQDGQEFIDYYRKHSMVLGKTITVYKSGYSPNAAGTPAQALDIDDSGGLVVLYNNGHQETLSTGEISIRL